MGAIAKFTAGSGGSDPLPEEELEELEEQKENRLIRGDTPLDTFNPDGEDFGERARQKIQRTQAPEAADQSQSQGALASAWGTVSGWADHAAGSTDEAVARSTDDEAGGGILDGFASAPGDLSGFDAYQETDDYAENREKARNASNWREGFDAAVQTGVDFTLDNPQVSVQEGLQAAMKKPTELARGEEVSDEELAESTQDTAAQIGSAWEDSAFSNPVTDFAAEAFVADPASGFLQTFTGVDPDEGTTEADVDTMELLEVPATLAGGGAATSGGKRLAAASDEGGSLVRRFLSGSDDSATLADDAAVRTDGGTLVDDGATVTDDATPDDGGVLQRLRDWTKEGPNGVNAGDDAAKLSDDAQSGADDVEDTFLLDEPVDAADESTTLVDDAKDTFLLDEPVQYADDSPGLFDDSATLADDSATLADDATAAGDDAGSVLSRFSASVDNFLGTTTGKLTAGGTALLGGSILADAAGVFDGDGGGGGGSGDGTGNEPPSDGTTWGEPTDAGTTAGGCQLVKQTSTGGGSVRYATLTGDSAGNVYALDASGTEHRVTEGTPMADYPLHGTKKEAEAACAAHGDDAGADDSAGSWGELQRDADLGNGWMLSHQERSSDGATRWFVTRSQDGQLQALNGSAQVEKVPTDRPLGQVPNFDTEADARSAYEEWAEANGGGDAGGAGGESSEWSEWKKLRKIDGTNWYLFGRAHEQDADRVEFVVTGKVDDTVVYLNKSGEVVDEQVAFTSMSAVQAAVQNYRQRKANGNVADDRQPNGDAPESSTIREHSKTTQSATQVSRMVEKLGGQKIVLAALAVAALLAYRRGTGGNQ